MFPNTDMIYHIRDARVEDAPALADTVIEPIVTTFHGRVPDQCLSWITKDESIANWQKWFGQDRDDGEFLLVAELMNVGVIGCALGGPQTADAQFAGELYLLGVLPAYQGHGIGRNLVGAVAARLLQQGIQSMQVRVLTLNPNRYFYERLGARYVGEQPYDWNGVLFTEALYGWPDVTSLLTR